MNVEGTSVAAQAASTVAGAAEQILINYESVDEYAGRLYSESCSAYIKNASSSKVDGESNLAANLRAHAAFDNDYSKLIAIKACGVQESRNLKAAAAKFKETDKELADG